MNPPTKKANPLIIGHRGASGLAPENTLPAFELALALGVDGVEFDVQLSADQQAVVIHDLRVDRTTPATGLVSRLSAETLSGLDAGAWFHRRLKTHPRLRAEVARHNAHRPLRLSEGELATVPTLDRVLNLIARASLKRVFIELKGPPEQTSRLLPIVLESVRRFKMESAVTIVSFDHRAIELASTLRNGVRTGALFSLGTSSAINAAAIVRKVRQIGADEAAVHFALASPRMVDSLHAEGISVSVWTINSNLMMRRLANTGVDAIMTNFPNRLAKVLTESAGPKRGISSRLRRRSLPRRLGTGRNAGK